MTGGNDAGSKQTHLFGLLLFIVFSEFGVRWRSVSVRACWCMHVIARLGRFVCEVFHTVGVVAITVSVSSNTFRDVHG